MAVGGERVEDGEVERERLPRRRAGRDDDVALARGRVRLGLVRVELGDPAAGERFADRGVQLCREASGSRLPRRLTGEVRKLVANEQVIPEQ
jgi:hypothetical protein